MLAPHGVTVVFPADLGIAPSSIEGSLEAFDTFEANARAKAHHFARTSGLLTLADDSGLEVDALRGAPGVRSRRFAGLDGGDEVTASANISALLEQLADVPDEARNARFRCVLVLSEYLGEDAFEDRLGLGTVEGRILTEPRGTGGFGYDPVFLSAELGLTFAEVSSTSKAAVSHRARAVTALSAALTAR